MQGPPDAAAFAPNPTVVRRLLLGTPHDLDAGVAAKQPRAGHHRGSDQARESERSCCSAQHGPQHNPAGRRAHTRGRCESLRLRPGAGARTLPDMLRLVAAAALLALSAQTALPVALACCAEPTAHGCCAKARAAGPSALQIGRAPCCRSDSAAAATPRKDEALGFAGRALFPVPVTAVTPTLPAILVQTAPRSDCCTPVVRSHGQPFPLRV